MINFKINGKAVTAARGETIINVARREGIYIPTMCYLEKTTPCASCRLCSVEVEGVDGFILSCNTPPTEGILVHTDSEKLNKERTNIMKMYDVNHPLECGVCDKSGACDLQNKTLEFNVGSQNFTARDQHRKIQHWGMINYDPSLCILCEKCVHVCNEIIGDDAIDLHFGGYSSSVVPKNSETLDCTYCGECIAVCPVGALVSSDFQYRANAWELERIPSTCAHCSAGCSLEYEVKHTSINTLGAQSIYRVTNNFEFETLCGAGRFGYDFENRKGSKEPAALAQAADALDKAETVRFGSMISNEEAMMLQALKSQKGVRLINKDAKAFADFIGAFAQTSGSSLYNGKLEDIAMSDQVIIIGSRISTDNPQVRYHLTMAQKRKKAKITYMHPIEDAILKNTITQFAKYEVGTEEGVMALLAKTLLEGAALGSEAKAFFEDLDLGYLSAESNIGEEELAAIAKAGTRSKKRTLILGQDLYMHAQAANIARLAGLVQRYTEIKIVMVPAEVNTLGVALICDLDEEAVGYSVGYNAQGDFVLSATEGDFAMPALNQQEGTVTSIDKQVLPINVALAFEGYVLLDLMKALKISEEKYTINYTAKLPAEKGFKAVAFDALENFVDRHGHDRRGYFLVSHQVAAVEKIEAVDDLPEFNGTILYQSNPVLQFNAMTAVAKQLSQEAILKGSEQFATAARISDGDIVEIDFGSMTIKRKFELDRSLKGTIALHPTFDLGVDALPNNYRFNKVKISKGEVI